MGFDEARSLPWWYKRLLIEGLDAEFGDPDAEPDVVVDATTPEGLAGLGFGTRTV